MNADDSGVLGVRPRRLFHGTCRPIEGEELLPAMPSGDVGDPAFPVVFASEHLDFATMFSLKTRAVTHISGGSFPHVIVPNEREYDGGLRGRVFVLDSAGFSPAVPSTVQNGKWWCPTPVPVSPARTIPIHGCEHLTRLGAVIIHVRDRSAVGVVTTALDRPESQEAWWDAIETLIRQGIVTRCDARRRDTRRSSESAVSALNQGSSTEGVNDILERFFDQHVYPLMPLRVRVRLTHGADHACRTALICRMLSNFLAACGVLRPPTLLELTSLLTAATFHDVARASDEGQDDSADESARAAERAMTTLGFSPDEGRHARLRIAHGAGAGADVDIGAAILQTADAFELMRNYVGDIWLSKTSLFEVLRSKCPAAIPAFMRVATRYAEWLRALSVWGLARGSVRDADGRPLVTSEGPVFDDVGVFKRNLAEFPFAATRASLRLVPELERLYERR